MRCPACKTYLAQTLDPAEWLTPKGLAKAINREERKTECRVQRGEFVGTLRATPSRFLVNRPRLRWIQSGERLSPAGSPARANSGGVPCPACARIADAPDLSPHVGMTEMCRYLKISMAAAKKRLQRGQLPSRISPPGKKVVWLASEVQRHYRIAMFAQELREGQT